MQQDSQLLKLPGLVDVHVHLREPGGTQKEDFATGTKAAITGGYTQILDMPNNTPPTDNPKALDQKIKLAKGRIWCDLGFNFGATAQSTKYFNKIDKKIFGLKAYMNQTTGTLLVDKFKDRDLIFQSWQSELPIMVHAEGETVEVAIKLAKKYRKNLHVCHITYDQVKTIEKAKIDGVGISCEVCPHHLFLSIDDVKKLGPLGIMKPPLLSKRDQQKLWENLGKVDIIASDHAPHTLEEKFDRSSPKFGVPGLETTLPLMMMAISKGLISLNRFIEMANTNPRRFFHLPAQPNTYLLIDQTYEYKIAKKKLFTKCQWTPFGDLIGKGEIRKVVIRGKTVYEKGKFIKKPQGKVIYPNLGLNQGEIFNYHI